MQVTRRGGWEALESLDGKFLFYCKAHGSTEIWKVGISGGEESLFLKNVAYRYWAVAKQGIYFIADADRVPCVKFIDFAKWQVTPIVRLEKKLATGGSRGLALSPDGHSLLCTLVEQDSSDIMLVENFR